MEDLVAGDAAEDGADGAPLALLQMQDSPPGIPGIPTFRMSFSCQILKSRNRDYWCEKMSAEL